MAATVRREPETQLGYSLPLPRWREIERLSNTAAYKMMSDGEIDTILLGSRRFVLLDSWRDYLDRQRRGVERDPAAKAAAAQRFAETAEISRQRFAPKHGTGGRIGSLAERKRLVNQGGQRSNAPPTLDRGAEATRLRLASQPAKE